MNMQQNISSNRYIDFIEDFKKGYPEAMEDTFLHGYCYWFAFILKERFNGIICYEPIENHFVTLLPDGDFYDIRGKLTETSSFVDWDVYKKIDELETKRIERDCINKIRLD